MVPLPHACAVSDIFALQITAVLCCRVRKDHWKGMTETEKRAIADMQLQQMAEKQSRKQQELQEEAEYADLQARIGRSILQQAYQVGTQLSSHSQSPYPVAPCTVSSDADLHPVHQLRHTGVPSTTQNLMVSSARADKHLEAGLHICHLCMMLYTFSVRS